jgi:hypothetical protein
MKHGPVKSREISQSVLRKFKLKAYVAALPVETVPSKTESQVVHCNMVEEG